MREKVKMLFILSLTFSILNACEIILYEHCEGRFCLHKMCYSGKDEQCPKGEICKGLICFKKCVNSSECVKPQVCQFLGFEYHVCYACHQDSHCGHTGKCVNFKCRFEVESNGT